MGDSRKAVFTINGQQQVLETTNNTTQTVVFTNVAPASGSITIDFTVAAGSQFAYLNVLDITESSSAGGRRITSEPVVATPAMDALEMLERLTVFPNPASEEIHVIVNDEMKKTIQLQMSDMMGRTIYDVYTFTNEEVRFDVSRLAKGIYLLKAEGSWKKIQVH